MHVYIKSVYLKYALRSTVLMQYRLFRSLGTYGSQIGAARTSVAGTTTFELIDIDDHGGSESLTAVFHTCIATKRLDSLHLIVKKEMISHKERHSLRTYGVISIGRAIPLEL